jgi:uncharacterized protein
MPEFVNPFVGMVPGKKMTINELLRALRLSLSAEEEATHIYQAIADACDHKLAKAVLNDIANEERVHKGEFQRLIEILAPDESDYMKQGAAEVDELVQNTKKTTSFESDIESPLTIGNLKNS